MKVEIQCSFPFVRFLLGTLLVQQLPQKLVISDYLFPFFSALMDCVGCEKCRLWGKLQVLGLGTALKILFSVDGKIDPNAPVSFMYFS